MEGTSVITAVHNKLAITKRFLAHVREKNRKDEGLEVIVFDNGSADGTKEALRGDSGIVYLRSESNTGVSKAFNRAAKAASHSVLCFMHNDVFIQQEGWARRLGKFVSEIPSAGVVGLYGAKTLRANGSFRGKSIVHSKAGGPAMKKPIEKVAAVDGLLIVIKKDVFERIRGFDEEFPIHNYDKDISMKAMGLGLSNYVISMPFEHLVGSTRKDITDEDELRRASRERFTQKWAASLPLDVSTWRERVSRALFAGVGR